MKLYEIVLTKKGRDVECDLSGDADEERKRLDALRFFKNLAKQ